MHNSNCTKYNFNPGNCSAKRFRAAGSRDALTRRRTFSGGLNGRKLRIYTDKTKDDGGGDSSLCRLGRIRSRDVRLRPDPSLEMAARETAATFLGRRNVFEDGNLVKRWRINAVFEHDVLRSDSDEKLSRYQPFIEQFSERKTDNYAGA